MLLTKSQGSSISFSLSTLLLFVCLFVCLWFWKLESEPGLLGHPHLCSVGDGLFLRKSFPALSPSTGREAAWGDFELTAGGSDVSCFQACSQNKCRSPSERPRHQHVSAATEPSGFALTATLHVRTAPPHGPLTRLTAPASRGHTVFIRRPFPSLLARTATALTCLQPGPCETVRDFFGKPNASFLSQKGKRRRRVMTMQFH